MLIFCLFSLFQYLLCVLKIVFMKQVTFEAVIGIGYKSDIAIDDVTLTTADCGK